MFAAARIDDRADRLDVVENSEVWVFKDRADIFRLGALLGLSDVE